MQSAWYDNNGLVWLINVPRDVRNVKIVFDMYTFQTAAAIVKRPLLKW